MLSHFMKFVMKFFIELELTLRSASVKFESEFSNSSKLALELPSLLMSFSGQIFPRFFRRVDSLL